MIASIELDEQPNPALPDESCPCCDKSLSRITGKLFDLDDEEMAAYIITWHTEPCEKPATLDFVFKEWNEEKEEEEGAVVSLKLHRQEDQAGVQLVDGNKTLLEQANADKVYTAEEIREWVPMQQLIQQSCQFIMVNDDRLQAIQTLSSS